MPLETEGQREFVGRTHTGPAANPGSSPCHLTPASWHAAGSEAERGFEFVVVLSLDAWGWTALGTTTSDVLNER